MGAVTTLSRLADLLAEAAAELEQTPNMYDAIWAAHMRRDADQIKLLALTDRHQQPAEVVKA